LLNQAFGKVKNGATYSRFFKENVVMRQCTSFLAIVTTIVLVCADANACFFRGRRHRCQTSYYTPACYDPGQAQQTTNQPTQTNSPNKETDELGLPALKELPKLPEAYFPSQQP
jgi:hypothetical protein